VTSDNELGEEKTREILRKDGYSEIVIDHWLNPRNLRTRNRKECDGFSDWFTGPCGDSMEICLKVRNDIIWNATFVSDICIGAVASGSMLTEMVKGKSLREALRISSGDILSKLGGLPEQFIHCAELAKNTLNLAINDYREFAREPWKRAYQQKY
jgi:nitrogen fixation NifU-like protein